MSLLGKIFVVVVTVLSLVFLGMQSTLYYHSTDWREAFERLVLGFVTEVAQTATPSAIMESRAETEDEA